MKDSRRETSESEAQYKRMMETPIPRLVTSVAIPTVIGMLITVIYNTADTYFVSQINKSASAAVGAVYAIMAIIQALGFGLGVGAGSL
ncbi:MAG: MATE family efflux transporter, partial [Clostridia bacterium]|nr:MATE family efflux transporter [Clostridia bacterium]